MYAFPTENIEACGLALKSDMHSETAPFQVSEFLARAGFDGFQYQGCRMAFLEMWTANCPWALVGIVLSRFSQFAWKIFPAVCLGGLWQHPRRGALGS